MSLDSQQIAAGMTIECRDEQWLVTNVTPTTDGLRIRCRGVSDFARDMTATFFTALDEIKIFDPADVEPKSDESPHFRHTRLWLESILRRTPVPLDDTELDVADRMLIDRLEYQREAVRKALSTDLIRPRVLLADAVGLGKTAEIGMILAELIRRGRGERILVVTPKHVMEQFQQELWTRFAIPLVRLDSQGIQRVRQKLPASRNPFTYFPRVIVSMDTLKSPKYRAQLEGVTWDAVVIDEIHNATNVGSQNNALARTLAPTTEALILASATPHNGKPSSFMEILRLLDPLSVLPNGHIDQEAVQKLLIRRHRGSPEVAHGVAVRWKQREEPRPIGVPASPEENAVAQEISREWLASAKSGKGRDHLFAWTLVKAFLSSPAALAESVQVRLKSRRPDDPERARLEKLSELNAAVTPDKSSKLRELISYLGEIGIKKGSKRRVVIFSERVATLKWLKEHLEAALKMPKGAVKIMHGGLSDIEQLELIDEFKRENTKLRVLITGDVASEGVNLHAQCHDLVHYDIPWSLIRIQQRNGRIDRYGQEEAPRIASLFLIPEDKDAIGDTRVLARLVEREHEANEQIGDVSLLMGKYTVEGEEEEIREVFLEHLRFDDAVPQVGDIVGAEGAPTPSTAAPATEEEQNEEIRTGLQSCGGADVSGFDFGLDEDEDDEEGEAAASAISLHGNSLYDSEVAYLEDALEEAFKKQAHADLSAGGVNFTQDREAGLVHLTPPDDLQARFDLLPQDYVDYRKIKEKLLLAVTSTEGKRQLDNARNGDSEKSWPAGHYLGPLHPVTEWASDRALASMARNEIPAVKGAVEHPTVLLLGTITNKHGQTITRAFITVAQSEAIQGQLDAKVQDSVSRWLREIGLTAGAVNPGAKELPETKDLIKGSIEQGLAALRMSEARAREVAEQRTERWKQRQKKWEESGPVRGEVAARTSRLIKEESQILDSLMPERKLIRPLLVVFPQESAHA